MKLRTLVLLLVMASVPCSALADSPLPDKTPTGILVDRVLPLSHMEELDGSAAAPATNPARWRQTLHELRRSAEKNLGWPAPRDVQAAGLKKVGRGDVALALVHARYDRLDDRKQAVANEVLALGALREDLYHGNAVTFVLDPGRIFTHRTSSIRNLTLDPDDGGGPRELEPGVPLSASYSATGARTLTLTVHLADGRARMAKATVNVIALETPAPTDTLAITATEMYDGSAASGLAYVYLAPGHATITNPVVVVEGFDLDNTMDWPVLYDLLNKENLLEDLRAAGFDAVVLDFTEATEPIQRNAFVVTELLTQVNGLTPSGTSVALIGASMGGLVSRYALLWLEAQAMDHHVRIYLSFDSPHEGANIPLGMQHWLRFFQTESTDAAFLLSRLETPAARQMLLYHQASTNGTTAAPDPLRAAWTTDLTSLGDWPSQTRMVAVTNGSGAMQDQGFTAGDQLILYEYNSLLVDIIGNVWAVPDGGAGQVIFDGAMNLIWPLPDSYETVTVSGTLPWDSAPGGFRDSMAQMDSTAASYGDIIALHDNHCFIPTVSALALEGVGPFHDIAGDPDLMTRTAFDQVYFPATNQEHIAVTAENKLWFMTEIETGLSAVEEETPPSAAGPVLSLPVPNPFNPRTRITYSLERAGRVELSVFDSRGRLVRNLMSGQRGGGKHSLFWNGRDGNGSPVAAGVYLFRIEAHGRVETKKATLVK